MTSVALSLRASARRPTARLNIRVAGAMLLAVVSVGAWVVSGGLRAPGAVRAPASTTRLAQLPVAAGTLVSRTLGRAERRYWAHPSGTGFASAGGGLRASFDPAGVTVRSGRVRLGMGLVGYGAGGTSVRLRQAVPTAARDRITYAQGPVRSWYQNGPLGLEQGFTITRPPGSAAGARSLSLTLRLSGNARVSLDGGTVTFSAGHRRLLYRGLSARDADGRILPARIGLSGGQLRLTVDAAGAHYPITVDPLIQQAGLTSSTHDAIGPVAVSADGRTIVTGAYAATVGANSDQGAAFVFTEPPVGGWVSATETAELTVADGQANDQFGLSVAISADGGTIVVGAPDAAGGNGAAYIFAEPSGGWASTTQATKLTPSAVGQDYFGHGVAVSRDGGVVVVGADGVGAAGTAYVFTKPAGGWGATASAPVATLSGSGAPSGALLGYSVAISDDGGLIAVGAPLANYVNPGYSGAVYVFAEPRTGWAGNLPQLAELTPSAGVAADVAELGYSTAISGDGETIVAGAPQSFGAKGAGQGEVLVFTEPGSGAWSSESQAAVLTSSNPTSDGGDEVGLSVSISDDGDVILAGAPDWGPAQIGQAYEYVKPGAGWASGIETAILGPASGGATHIFGDGVAAVDTGGAPTLFVSAGRTIDPADHRAINVYGMQAAPSITSVDTASFTAGTPGSFTVTTGGLPTPSLSESGTLPPGMTFTDNGNGTATLAGTPSTAGTYPLTITASNGVSPDDVQPFAITVNAVAQTATTPTTTAPATTTPATTTPGTKSPTATAPVTTAPTSTQASLRRPNTRITRHIIRARRRTATFRFKRIGRNRATHFQCALVRLPTRKHARAHRPRYARCRSPKAYRRLRAHARYRFYVRAVNSAGADRTPASYRFRA